MCVISGVKSVKKQEYITRKNLACISKAIACVLQQKWMRDTMYQFMALFVSNKHVKFDYVRLFLTLVYKYTTIILVTRSENFFVIRAFDCITQSKSAIIGL